MSTTYASYLSSRSYGNYVALLFVGGVKNKPNRTEVPSKIVIRQCQKMALGLELFSRPIGCTFSAGREVKMEILAHGVAAAGEPQLIDPGRRCGYRLALLNCPPFSPYSATLCGIVCDCETTLQNAGDSPRKRRENAFRASEIVPSARHWSSIANHLHRSLRILLTIVVLAAGIFVACNRMIFVMEILHPMLMLTLASMVILLFSLRPRLEDVVFVACLTLLHGAVAFLFFDLPYHNVNWPAFAGFSSFWVLCIRTIWEKGAERKWLVYATFSAILLLTVESVAATVMLYNEKLHPKTLDLFLYSFDGSLGMQFSFLMGRAFAKWPLFKSGSMMFYDGLPVAMTLICARHIAARTGKALSVITAIVATGPIGVAFYNLFPALGPGIVPQLGFPFHVLTRAQTMNLALVEIAVPGPRNAIPSLHMAWVLLIWWYSRGLSSWTRAIALLFLIFTVASTLGSGQHYLVDLVVGLPFAVFLESLCSLHLPWPDRRRILALAWGLGATLTWLALLRFTTPLFWISPMVPWGLILATILLSWIYERGLQSTNYSSAVPEAEFAASGSGFGNGCATDSAFGQAYKRRTIGAVQESPRQDDAEAEAEAMRR
jgi:hypothetical protein